MKKIILFIITALMICVATPLPLNANPANKTISNSESPEAKQLLTRLDIINNLDESTLNRAEKKQLRREVRTIHHRLKDINGGIYISAGALIVILILLIILL